MEKLSFWHRVVFIANICWLATWFIKYYTILPKGDLQSTVIINGLIIAPIVNCILNGCTAFYWFRRRLAGKVPRWLVLVNFAFFIAELYIFIK